MKKVIINADDFGYCEAVNYGILESYRQGIVSSTSLMANMPGFDHAAAILKENPKLGLGIHLTLTCYKPVGTGYHSLTDEQGYFIKNDLDAFDMDEVFTEWCLQMEKIQAAGLQVDHIDSHHHLHNDQRFAQAFQKFYQRYPLPIRDGLSYSMEFTKGAKLFGKFYKQNVSTSFLQQFFQTMEEDQPYDIMCHPAYVDSFLSTSTSYALERMKEYDVLTDELLKECLHQQNIQLITYRDL